MYFECRHVTPSGRKCKQRLLDNSTFCYNHRNLHELMYAPAPRPGTPFRMPLLEDSHGCIMGVQQVCWAMGDKRITQGEAGIYLRAVTIVKGLLPRRPNVTRKPVHSLCYDNDALELAEPFEACEPPRDCLTCQKTATCIDFEYYEDEVEELEQALLEEEELKNQQASADQQTPESSQTEDPMKPRPEWMDPQYDNMPNVRALLREMDEEAQENQRLRAEQQAKINENKEAPSNLPPPQQRLSS